MSDLSDAAAEAVDDFQTGFGEAVTYGRTGQSNITPTGTLEELDVDVADEEGVFYRVPEVFFRVSAADIDFGSGAVDPARGDIVTRADGRVYDAANKGKYLAEWAEWRIPLTERT